MKTGIDHWLPDVSFDDNPALNVGSASVLSCGDDPPVKHPIGFRALREKPRVRVKAWTRPILERET
jgi:hypothetical protein